MNNLYETLPFLAQYHLAILCLAGICLITLVQSFLIAPLAFSKEQVPGMPLRFDHSKLSFRAVRSYQNFLESLPVFGLTLLAAIIFGVDAYWVNLLAVVYLVFRVLFWAVYYSGIGKVAGGPRTLMFVGSNLSNTVLAIMAVYAGLSYGF